MDLQAQDRAHRIGQKKEVQVFRFCTEVSCCTQFEAFVIVCWHTLINGCGTADD